MNKIEKIIQNVNENNQDKVDWIKLGVQNVLY